MLTHEIMGLFALAVLWVNTLLVAGAALGQLRKLMGWLRTLRSLRPAAVKSAPEGVFARFAIEQVGRRAADDDDRPAILFHDRNYHGEVNGGELEIAGERITIDRGGEVWVESEALARAAACPSVGAFDEAYSAARKAKGHVRTVEQRLRTGDVVHVAGLEDGAVALVASFDPRPLMRRKATLLAGFAFGMVALSASVTALCLIPPLFGFWSTLGGILGLIHFLLVMQPLGVSARDAARPPSQTALRGSWIKSAAAEAPAPGAELYAD
jgi:hypothetical protein